MQSALLALALLAVTAPAQARSSDARPPGPLDRVAERVVGGDSAVEAVVARLDGYDALLEMLPIDALERVESGRRSLDLTFDFGKRSTRRVRIPATSQWVLDGRGRPREIRSDARTLIVKERVRLEYDGTELRSVRSGDLELKYGIFRPNVDLRSAREAGRIVRDGDGRPVLELDESGRPFRRDGAWALRRSDRWLVVKVKSRELWIPVDQRGSPQKTNGAQ